jgi:hypothetical protein
MYQGRQTVRAHPQAATFMPARQQHRPIFACPAAKAGLGNVRLAPLVLQLLSRVLIKRHRLALLHGQRSRRAYGQTETCAIAQGVADHMRFPIQELDGPLGAGSHTQATSVAQFLINPDNLSFSQSCLPPQTQ